MLCDGEESPWVDDPVIKTVTAAILVHEGKILIAWRGVNDRLAGHWEFPGGTLEVGESPEDCLARELREEFAIEIEVGTFVGESVYHYNHGAICLIAYLARWKGGSLECRVHERFAWVHIEELGGYVFSPADLPFVKCLQHGEISID
ncbi:MAG: (deoxy)nucleoside triphosphate pyrophosphohydrolase [Deltaproteobacteria bacterium]|nr:(deoxy)nucleoside triphosphate pyrophosphohydrolase [Deltaproteobacteria bacterium]